MIRISKKVMRWVLERLDLYSLYRLKERSALRDLGWFRSYRDRRAVGSGGEPVPWYTYPAIEFLEIHLTPNLKLFEFGCGASTLWWASRVEQVVACEHDRGWYEHISQRLPDNAQAIFVDSGEVPKRVSDSERYADAITKMEQAFDIVVIDGIDRVKCARTALSKLSAGGIIIWDNSDQVSDSEGYEFLQARGFRRLEFIGMGPINTYSWETSVFYRPGNVLNI